jgi:toluene monooxygenase system ferredoxin subunit
MTWKRVCSVDAIAENSLKQFEVDGVPILVANVGNGFRAYPPLCPHMEEPLAQSGICGDGVLTCTKHLWQWDMHTGEVRGPAEKPLLMYEVKLDGGDVLVFVEKELTYEYEEEDEEED